MVLVHVRVWEYEVPAEHLDAFVAAYGADGDWSQMFRRGRGYGGTDLYRAADGSAQPPSRTRLVPPVTADGRLPAARAGRGPR